MPSPPLPELGLAMKVNFGWACMYDSSWPASSGSKKLIGLKLNYFSNVFRIRLVTEQKTFFLAMYSIIGYLLYQNLFLATLL